MADDDDEQVLEGELTAEDVLTFGPCVEAVVWTPMWLQEKRAPIAVTAGRPKLGPIFNSDGVGRAVVIRPCISRGRRIRGLAPIYTPSMLEGHSNVYDGWPMFMDHVPPALAETLAKYGRSVKELGGQLLKGWWDRMFTQENDGDFGYQPGATLAEIWATPFIRRTVGENANLLHTSINAWPKSGKPGPVPWRKSLKGMVIEGIRRVPQGSVDFVVRGGAGGKLLVQEGLEEEGAWPEAGAWSDDDTALVVSVAESLYASAHMAPTPTLPQSPDELRAYLQEHAPHLLSALGELDAEDEPLIKALMKKGKTRKQAEAAVSGSKEEKAEEGLDAVLTEADVRKIVTQLSEDAPSAEEFEESLTERVEEMLAERDTQRAHSALAFRLIEKAEGLPESWKKDLQARYAMLPSGAPTTLIVEAEMDGETVVKTAEKALEEKVAADIQHARNLCSDARGKPRVTGEGGAKPDAASGEGSKGKTQEGQVPYWRERFAGMNIISESDKAESELYGADGKVAG